MTVRRRRSVSEAVKKDIAAFVAQTREWKESPAWRALSNIGRRVLDRLELQHLRTFGRCNGQLVCTWDQFEEWGCRRKSLDQAIAEAAALGFLVVVREGYSDGKTVNIPALYRLTYVRSVDDKPRRTDEWLQIKTPADAQAALSKARADVERRKREKAAGRSGKGAIIEPSTPAKDRLRA